MKYKAIFFDPDDTLLDTYSNTTHAVEEIYNNYELSRFFSSFDEFHKIYRANNNYMWDLFARGKITKDELTRGRFVNPLNNIPEIKEDQALNMNADYLESIVKKEKLVAGTLELLDYLKPLYKMHIISNGFSNMQYKKMESAGIASYFEQIILSDEVGVSKPDPLIFQTAIERTGVNVGEVVMIGDNYYSDIFGAYTFGIDQIWFNPDKKEASDIIPTYSIESLAEIKNIL